MNTLKFAYQFTMSFYPLILIILAILFNYLTIIQKATGCKLKYAQWNDPYMISGQSMTPVSQCRTTYLLISPATVLPTSPAPSATGLPTALTQQ